MNDSTYIKFQTTILTSNDDRGQNRGTFEGYQLQRSPGKDVGMLEISYNFIWV